MVGKKIVSEGEKKNRLLGLERKYPEQFHYYPKETTAAVYFNRIGFPKMLEHTKPTSRVFRCDCVWINLGRGGMTVAVENINQDFLWLIEDYVPLRASNIINTKESIL